MTRRKTLLFLLLTLTITGVARLAAAPTANRFRRKQSF
jgi:hypothetical protein